MAKLPGPHRLHSKLTCSASRRYQKNIPKHPYKAYIDVCLKQVRPKGITNHDLEKATKQNTKNHIIKKKKNQNTKSQATRVENDIRCRTPQHSSAHAVDFDLAAHGSRMGQKMSTAAGFLWNSVWIQCGKPQKYSGSCMCLPQKNENNQGFLYP